MILLEGIVFWMRNRSLARYSFRCVSIGIIFGSPLYVRGGLLVLIGLFLIYFEGGQFGFLYSMSITPMSRCLGEHEILVVWSRF